MSLSTTPAIVLRRARHLEKDVRMSLFCRDLGKVLVTSKGGQKAGNKLAALQEPFSEIDAHLFVPQHGVYGRLVGGKLSRSNPGIRANVVAFELACRSCEAVETLMPFRAAQANVYDALSSALRRFDTGGDPRMTWIRFSVELLVVLGHGDMAPEIERLLEPGESFWAEGEGPMSIPASVWSRGSMIRALACVETQLERVLPWRLKAETTFTHAMSVGPA